MTFKWEKVELIKNNKTILAPAPVIISASRSTDIPAFYPEWFVNRLKEGYAAWKNPFSGDIHYISFEKTRAIVFWTKDAHQILKHLPLIDKMGINYYFQFSVNDYEKEGYEPNLRPLKERIETFKTLAESIGKERVIWRFDPLMITQNIPPKDLIERVARVGDKLYSYTEKLVFSFVDISSYSKVQSNLLKANIGAREFSPDEMKLFAQEISSYSGKNWGIKLATCAEATELNSYGIEHNKCVDDELLRRCFPRDGQLMKFLGYDFSQANMFTTFRHKGRNLKDAGQRKACGCIYSKDIGAYNTCNHLCVYCYANSSDAVVKANMAKYDKNSEAIAL